MVPEELFVNKENIPLVEDIQCRMWCDHPDLFGEGRLSAEDAKKELREMGEIEV